MGYSAAHLFDWEILHSIEYQNEIAVSAFNKIIENQEKVYSVNNDELKEKIENDKYLNSLSEGLQGSYFMANYESELHAIEEVKRFQRNSTCLSIFSYFEGQMKNICELIEKKYAYKTKIASLKDRDNIRKYWNYLIDVYKIDTSIEQYLSPIIFQRFVRNKIAHQNGFITKGQCGDFVPTAGVFLEKYNDEYQITITDTIYLTNIIEKMDFFLKQLLSEVDKRFSIITEQL
jgi:hypothetical protein